MKFISVF